jgi:K+-transporting ATPase KdpF subunit
MTWGTTPLGDRQDPVAAAGRGRILWVVAATVAVAEEVRGDGRRGLRAGVRRRLRAAGDGAAGVGAAVTVQNVIGGLAALALIVYLFVALIRPERF